jgi:hypothetical protein
MNSETFLRGRTAKLHQEAFASGGNTSPEHIAEKAELHRMRITCANFVNALVSNF